MLNIGADIRLFKDLSLTFDWYEKTTSGMLITPPISSIGGTWATAINSGKYVTEVGNLVQITTNSLKTLASVFMAVCLKIKIKS